MPSLNARSCSRRKVEPSQWLRVLVVTLRFEPLTLFSITPSDVVRPVKNATGSRVGSFRANDESEVFGLAQPKQPRTANEQSQKETRIVGVESRPGAFALACHRILLIGNRRGRPTISKIGNRRGCPTISKIGKTCGHSEASTGKWLSPGGAPKAFASRRADPPRELLAR